MSIDLLESSDLSETQLGSNLAKTLRDVGRAAGVSGGGKDDLQDETHVERREEERPLVNMGSTPAPIFDLNMPTFNTGNSQSLENFFLSDNELDLSYLLGLTRDGDGTHLQDDGSWSMNNAGTFTNFGLSTGGLGSEVPNSNWNGALDGLGTVFGYPEDNYGTH